ncbi:MAG: hypothetical protein E7547_04975 [Ruminococcaceae bacterium]|nr:hypothetical protein [Oscillospiraceae bacterium]
MKKIISIIIAVLMMFSLCATASAGQSNDLSFGDDGKFTILQISDPQDDHYPAYDMVNMIKISIEQTNPDLIVFTGDIVEDSRAGDFGIDGENMREGVEVDDYAQTLENVKTACAAVFAEAEKRNIPFAVTQGNNDYGCGVKNEDWMKIYNSYKNCIVLDESNDAEGRIDYNLEIKASNSDKTVLNIWLMDTAGSGVTDEQLGWYKTESAALKVANSGKPVPSILFQHIPTGDLGYFFEECNFWDEGARNVDGKYYRLNHDVANGYHASAFTPVSDTSAQFKAWKECGDVLGAYFGHWHTEGFTGTYDGIELGMTYGCEFAKPGPYGVRVFTFNENNIEDYENVLYTYEGKVKLGNARLELQIDKPYAEYNNIIEKIIGFFVNVFKNLKAEIVTIYA